MRNKDGRVQVSLRLPKRLHDQLRDRVNQERTVQGQIVIAVERYLMEDRADQAHLASVTR